MLPSSSLCASNGGHCSFTSFDAKASGQVALEAKVNKPVRGPRLWRTRRSEVRVVARQNAERGSGLHCLCSGKRPRATRLRHPFHDTSDFDQED